MEGLGPYKAGSLPLLRKGRFRRDAGRRRFCRASAAELRVQGAVTPAPVVVLFASLSFSYFRISRDFVIVICPACRR